jgi:predicted kinase
MPKLYIMRGLPGCGKTTYCREHLSHCVRVNRDALRWMVYGGQFNSKRERDVTIAEHGCVMRALADNKDVVVDATNLNRRAMEQWEAIAKIKSNEADIYLEVVDLTNVPPWTCVERDSKRPPTERVGPDVIWDKWYKYLAPSPYTGQKDAPHVIISDLDGTVRDNSWRDAFDTTGKCIDDPPRWHVINAIRGLQDDYTEILFFSGMEGTDANYKSTQEWLERYFTNFSLYMRNVGDTSRDSAVKRDMFHDYVEEKGLNVDAVFDDRPQVIRECWVSVGLYDRIFSVGKYGLEF